MRPINGTVKSLLKKLPGVRAAYQCLQPLLPQYPPRFPAGYLRFWRTYFAYWRLHGQRPCRLSDINAQIGDWQSHTPISFYFYQDTWTFHQIALRRPSWHLDIGSTALLVGCLAGIVRTISLDLRPVSARLPGLQPLAGLMTQLPFAGDSVESISSLCVIEHIGLGRYGDPLDPEGTAKAARELSRVLAPRGNLYVSAPCGRSYIAFNAHRSFTRDEFTRLFPSLRLEEFVLVNSLGVTNEVRPDPCSGLHVGLFRFTK